MKRAFSHQSQRLTRQRFEGFLRRNETVLSPTLQRTGWVQARVTNDGYLTEFERVIREWVRNRFGLALPTPKSIDFDPDVAASLPFGGGYIGPQSRYNALVRQQEIQRALQTLNNIASGPIGAFGYQVGGDAGSDLGALVDGVAGAAGQTAAARSQFQALSQPPVYKPEAAVVEPASRSKGTSNRGTDNKGTDNPLSGPASPK